MFPFTSRDGLWLIVLAIVTALLLVNSQSGTRWLFSMAEKFTDGALQVQAIDGALARLDGLENVPLDEHVARFDAVHATLTDALSSIDKV